MSTEKLTWRREMFGDSTLSSGAGASRWGAGQSEGLGQGNRLRSSDIQPAIRVDAPLSRRQLAMVVVAVVGEGGRNLLGGSRWSLSHV